MAKDHYIARTYLRNFSANNNEMVLAYRKKTMEKLGEVPVKSICYKKDWSTNEYFSENPRIIEDFLKIAEPNWNKCVNDLTKGFCCPELKFTASLYLAFLRICTPTAVRLNASLLKGVVDLTHKFLEEKSLENPESQHHDMFQKIKDLGGVTIKVNDKYSSAIAISGIGNAVESFSSCDWRILVNETGIPFLTSDNPVIPYRFIKNAAVWYCPITPYFAISFSPIHKVHQNQKGYDVISIKKADVKKYNKLIVKGAEDIVIYNPAISNIYEIMDRYKYWRVEKVKDVLSIENERILFQHEKFVNTEKKEAL